MPKIPQCSRCLFYSHNPHIICSVHPSGVIGDNCIDFREDPNGETEELWQPDGATYYNGQLIVQPPPITPERQLELLEWHPIFTGKCPRCSFEFDRDYGSRVHWDCAECGWMDDSI